MSELEKNNTQKEPRRLIKLDLIDEKLQALADRGIILVSGPMGEGSSNMLFLTMSGLHISKPAKPIWIILKSEGGYIEEGLAMIDVIRAFIKKGTEVNILGVGVIASMAAGVMQAGVKRYALPYTQFMIHEVSQEIVARENASESEDRTTEIKRVNNIFLDIISTRSGVDRAKLASDVHKKDLWLDAQQAKTFGPYGLIDEVVETYPFDI